MPIPINRPITNKYLIHCKLQIMLGIDVYTTNDCSAIVKEIIDKQLRETRGRK